LFVHMLLLQSQKSPCRYAEGRQLLSKTVTIVAI
jgi:hypothetical protein